MSAQNKLLPSIMAAVFAASSLLAPSLASAQVGRYKRKSIEVKVKKTDKTAKLTAREPKKGEKKQEVPEITADQFMQIETKVQTIRDEQIREYIGLIKDTDADDPERPDLLFRLAELYAQKQRHLRFQGMEYYAKIEKAKSKSQKAQLQRKQQQYFQAEKKWLVQSIRIYKQIAENPKFKDYPRMDEALFYYAFTLQSAKYLEEARKVFYRLIKDYPQSKYIPDAYLSFADYYFDLAADKGDRSALGNAEKFYDKVLQFPKSGVYAYALYKKGWVYLNQDRNQDALETFFKVVQITRKDKRKRTLNKAAKKDFVRAYSEVGKPQLAYKAFQRVDKKYAFKMLQILGDLYLDKGKAEKTIYVFHELMSVSPKNKLVCDWQYTVTRAMLTIGDQSQKVKEIERLVKLYTYLKDQKSQQLDQTGMSECRENAQETTSELAKIWHQEAEKTLNTETLQYVDALYKLYMTAFPDAEDFGEMQFYYGELLWRRAETEKNPRIATERWEDAAVQFTTVVQTGKVDKKLMKEAAYAAVLGWKNALAVDPRTKAPPVPKEDTKEDDKVPEPEKIPDRELKMVDAFDVYIKYIKDKKDPELVMMKFLKARTFWRYKHFDEAIPLFEDIVENHLDAEPGEWAVNLLLDSYNRSHNYADMVKWVDVLLTKKQFLSEHEELADRLDLLKAQSMRKAAEQLEKDQKYVECGEAYREIFNRTPNAEGMAEVLYNAGVCYEKGKSMGLAINMREQLIKRYPKDNLSRKALVLLGNNYGAIAYYTDAATKFEEYSKSYGGEKDAANALANAVFYRKGIGQDDKAIKDIEFFIKQYGRNKTHVKEAAAALYGMTGIIEKTNNDDKIVKHLRRYLKEYGTKGGVDWQIAAYVRVGEIMWQNSCPVKGVDGACISIQRSRASRVKRKKGKRRHGVELPTQCGPESKIKLTVHDRKGALVKEAKKNFQQAIKLYKNGKAVAKVPGKDDAEKASRVAVMTYYVAAANFYLAEEEYEAFLRIKFPDKLNFDPKKEKKKKESEKRLLKWKEEKEKQLVKTSKMYTGILDFKRGGEAWAIAGAARVGQLFQNYSDQLFTAEIPKDVRTGAFAEDKVDAYCDALMELANPLEEKSVGAFAFCLDESTKRNWFNQWSRLCERELGQIRPLDFPSASEVHAEPTLLGDVVDRPNLIEEMKQ